MILIVFVVEMFSVRKCPKNLIEKNDASKRLGCGRDKFDKDQYMCTPNAEKTFLVEFCHKGIMGIKEKGLDTICKYLHFQILH